MVSFNRSDINDAFAVLTFDKAGIEKVAGRRLATFSGIVILLVPAILNLIFASLIFPSGFGAIFQGFLFWSMILPFVALVGAIFVTVYFDYKLKGGLKVYMPFFRIFSHAAIVLWLTFLPFLLDFLGFFAAENFFNVLWYGGIIWIAFVVYKVFKSYFTVGIFLLSYILLQLVLGKFIVGSYYSMFF